MGTMHCHTGQLPGWFGLIKPWPADLVVKHLKTAGGEKLFSYKQGSIVHSLSLSFSHYYDMTELLKRMTVATIARWVSLFNSRGNMENIKSCIICLFHFGNLNL